MVAQDANLEVVEGKLIRRAIARKLISFGGILVGLPLVLIAPLLLSTMFWIVSGMLFDRWYHWGWFFLILSLITVPLLFRLEIQTSGNYLSSTLRDSGPLIYHSDEMVIAAHVALGALAGVAVAVASDPQAATAGFMEIFLTGPRMVLNGLRHLRQVRAVPAIEVRRAAMIVAALLARDSGVEPAALRVRGEAVERIWPVLFWLAFYEWIGVSEDRTRVFLYSESRKAFRER